MPFQNTKTFFMQKLLSIVFIIGALRTFSQTATLYNKSGIKISYSKTVTKTVYCNKEKKNVYYIKVKISIENGSSTPAYVSYSTYLPYSQGARGFCLAEDEVFHSNEFLTAGFTGTLNAGDGDYKDMAAWFYSTDITPGWSVNEVKFQNKNDGNTKTIPANSTSNPTLNPKQKTTSINQSSDYVNVDKQQKRKEQQYQLQKQEEEESERRMKEDQDRAKQQQNIQIKQQQAIAEENRRRQEQQEQRRKELQRQSDELKNQTEEKIQRGNQTRDAVNDAIDQVGNELQKARREKEERTEKNEKVKRELDEHDRIIAESLPDRKNAALSGDVRECAYIGSFYTLMHYRRDLEQGSKYLKLGALLGDTRCFTLLSDVYRYGDANVRKNPDLALEILKTAGEKGDLAAIRGLILLYSYKSIAKEYGVTSSKTSATYWENKETEVKISKEMDDEYGIYISPEKVKEILDKYSISYSEEAVLALNIKNEKSTTSKGKINDVDPLLSSTAPTRLDVSNNLYLLIDGLNMKLSVHENSTSTFEFYTLWYRQDTISLIFDKSMKKVWLLPNEIKDGKNYLAELPINGSSVNVYFLGIGLKENLCPPMAIIDFAHGKSFNFEEANDASALKAMRKNMSHYIQNFSDVFIVTKKQKMIFYERKN
jgi:hypothetical protein